MSSVLSPFASQPPQKTADCFHPPAAPAKGTEGSVSGSGSFWAALEFPNLHFPELKQQNAQVNTTKAGHRGQGMLFPPNQDRITKVKQGELELFQLLLALEGQRLCSCLNAGEHCQKRATGVQEPRGRPAPTHSLRHPHLEGLPDAVQLGKEILVTVAAEELCPRRKGEGLHKCQFCRHPRS